ncbi:MAG: ABC transporter substrate-binding protein, partial [Lacisediminihabitans sp.]
MSKRTIMFGAALFVSITLIATGCTTASTTPTASTDTIRTTIDIPATFDPTLDQSLPDFLLARTSYDTLVRRDKTGLVPGLATKWSSTPTSATFTIRQDATCSDGTKITPTVVKNSLEYLARPNSGSTQSIYAFGPGNTPVVTADDAAGTVDIKLQVPWPFLAQGLSISATGIICPKGLADPKALAAGTAKGSESGPYTLKSSEPGVHYEFALRKDYKSWPKWTTKIGGTPAATLIYNVSPDPTSTANLILSGQMDIGKIQAQTTSRFKGQSDYKVTTNRFSDFYLLFNERPGSAFADEAARKGAVQAIDRATFVKVTSLNTGQLPKSLASNETQCVADAKNDIPAQDVAAATSALKGKTIRLIGPNIAGAAGAGNEYLAEALRSAGATVKLTNTDLGSWISTLITKPDDWDVTMYADLNFLGSLASPLMNFTGPTITEGGSNFGAIHNPAAEAAFTAASGESDQTAQCGDLNKAIDALISRSDALPLDNDPFIYASRPGFTVHMLGGALDDPIFRIG